MNVRCRRASTHTIGCSGLNVSHVLGIMQTLRLIRANRSFPLLKLVHEQSCRFYDNLWVTMTTMMTTMVVAVIIDRIKVEEIHCFKFIDIQMRMIRQNGQKV